SLELQPQRRELRLEVGGHRLRDDLAHVDAQALLEAVAPPAPVAPVEMLLRLDPLLLAEDVVEIRLHHLLTVRAWVFHPSPSTMFSASSRFKMRRPRSSRDTTVPIG